MSLGHPLQRKEKGACALGGQSSRLRSQTFNLIDVVLGLPAFNFIVQDDVAVEHPGTKFFPTTAAQRVYLVIVLDVLMSRNFVVFAAPHAFILLGHGSHLSMLRLQVVHQETSNISANDKHGGRRKTDAPQHLAAHVVRNRGGEETRKRTAETLGIFSPISACRFVSSVKTR